MCTLPLLTKFPPFLLNSFMEDLCQHPVVFEIFSATESSWLLNHKPSWPCFMWFSDKNSFGYDMGWWKEEHFNASDADGDGLLNITEFNEWASTLITKFNFGKRETCYSVLIGACHSQFFYIIFQLSTSCWQQKPKATSMVVQGGSKVTEITSICLS
jgi:hypothetical protein